MYFSPLRGVPIFLLLGELEGSLWLFVPVLFGRHSRVCLEVAREGGLLGEAKLAADLVDVEVGIVAEEELRLGDDVLRYPVADSDARGLAYHRAEVFWREVLPHGIEAHFAALAIVLHDDAFATLFEFFHSLPFLRTLGAEHRFADSPCYALTVLKDGTCVLDRLTVLFGALIGAILVGGEIVILGAAGTLAAKGAIPVGDVVVYQLLFLAAMQSVQGIVSLLPETASLCEGIDSLDEIFARPTPRRHICKDVGTVKSVEFRNVTYSYPGAEDRPVVKDFSATFHAGRLYALVGANGAGKTTLLKLATGALVRQSGEILVNGTTMKAVDEDAFRRETGIVFQDSLLLSGSVRDNITLRDPMFTDVDVMMIIRQIGLENMVKRLPDGLNTRLGLRGQLLSGGELQRLAIARALVRNPSVLVLDEATNHLDAAARASFAKLLRDLASGRIVLIVSHDDEIINLCDKKIFCQISKCTSYVRA